MTRAVFRNFVRDRRANVAMIFALSAIPLVFVVGMAIDYGAAARLKSKLNAAADAAALAATAPSMMTQSDAAAIAAATNMFNAEVTGLSRLIFDGSNQNDLKVLVTHPANNPGARNVTVTYAAQSQNIFGNILNVNTIAFGGGSTGFAATPPSTNFYLLIDTSPSMAIPASTDGIAAMVKATPTQGPNSCRTPVALGGSLGAAQEGSLCGCAFACHETNPSAENPPLGNPGGEDNYTLARNLNIALRIDSVAGSYETSPPTPGAAQNMVQFVINKINQNIAAYGYSPLYQIAVSSFDTGIHNLFPLTTASSSAANVTQLQNLVSELSANPSPIKVQEVYSNNVDCTSFNSNGTCKTTSATGDTDTNIDAALTAVNNPANIASYIPTAGNGYAPNPPAQVLMIVTDGVEDEIVGSVTAGTADGSRQQAPFAANSNTPSYALCQAIKARGIQIAILYTTYFPLDAGNTGSWYDQFIYQFQPNGTDQIGTALQNNCASPGLFITVPVGGDISAGLSTLISLTINGSHLTQ
jgi:Flp pilus assembly protein TadG